MRQAGERIGTSADLETVAERNIRAGTRAPSPTVKSRRNPGQVFQEPPSNVVGFAVKCGKNLQTPINTRGEEYVEQGMEIYEQRRLNRSFAHLDRRAKQLGYQLVQIAENDREQKVAKSAA